MKTRIFTFMKATAWLLILSLVFTACHSKKKLPKADNPSGEREITIYCSGPDYTTNDKYIRDNAIGVSPDEYHSEEIAFHNARTKLAKQINVIMSGMIDRYASSVTAGKAKDFEDKVQGFSRSLMDDTKLIGSHEICKKRTIDKDGNYKTYIAIELSSDDLFNEINNRISEDTKTKIDYDYEKFKKSYEDALKEYRERNK